MIPLPAALGGAAHLTAWRLDPERCRQGWDRGEGARLYGGRWNSQGRPAVYLSIDPAASILEVAVHKSFSVFTRVPHVMTAIAIQEPGRVHVVQPEQMPDRAWLEPGWPSAAQQAHGDALLATHGVVLLPSTVSRHSWNLVMDPQAVTGLYRVILQEPFLLDPRLRGAS